MYEIMNSLLLAKLWIGPFLRHCM